MQEDHKFTKSKYASKTTLAVVWGLLLVSIITLNILLKTLSSLLGVGETGFRFVLNLVLLGALGLATVYYKRSHNKMWVKVGQDTLTLQKWMHTTLIDYSEISSVSAKQTPLGKKYDYGTVTIRYNNGQPSLTINSIEHPQEFSRLIKDRTVASKQTITIAQ